MKIDTSITQVINLLAELIVYGKYDFPEFLKRFIAIATQIIPADSCLIYFYDKEKKMLTLVGSTKSHEKAIGHIIMQEGEGITGWVVQHKETVVIPKKAYEDPRFKSFKDLPEDKYEGFLSVPILDVSGVAGVINFQTKAPQNFSDIQITTIQSLVQIIASALITTLLSKKITKLETQLEERKLLEKAKGILMKVRRITEEEAFRLIRSESMNKRKSMKEIAEAILIVWQ